MPTLVSDVSSFQRADRPYFKYLYNQGVRFNFVKLTQGVDYTNPRAFAQIRSSLSVFGSVGVYHYWTGESASHFLRVFKQTGLDPHTTKFMLDVELTTLPYYLAGYINTFFKQLVDAGFKPGNLWTYTNTAQFLQTGRIIVSHLKYGFVWAAKYPTMSQSYNDSLGPWSRFRPSANMWQFNGTGQDLSYDYTDTFRDQTPSPTRRKSRKKLPAKKDEKNTNRYLTRGRSFRVINNGGVNAYKDLYFKTKPRNDVYLPKGSVIPGKIIKMKHITRLDTPLGFVTSNTKYLKTDK